VTWAQEVFSNPDIYARDFVPDFYPQYIDDGDNTASVKITAGKVSCYEASATVSSITLPLESATDAWIEITNAPGSTSPTINTTIQTGSLPAFAAESSGTITIAIPVGTIASDEYTPYLYGAVELASTIHQPDFHADVRGAGGEQSIRVLGIKTLASKGDNTKTLLLQARTTDIDVLGGNVEDQTDVAEIKLYGVDDDVTVDHVEDVDTSTDDEMTFDRNTYTNTQDAGLTQANEVAAATGTTIDFDATWIKQVGATIFHDKTTQGGSEDWTSIDHSTFTGITYYDNNGHLQKIDSTSSPGPTKKWKYRECGGTTVIYRNSDGGAVLEISSTCYERLGQVATSAAANTDSATVYSTCALCEAAVVNEEWLKCSDDSAAVIYAPGDTNIPVDDYAWILIGGVYIKCYMNQLVATAAGADPCSISTNASAPSACADVKLDYFTDSFPGSSRRACYWPTESASVNWIQSADTVSSGQWTHQGYVSSGGGSKFYAQDNISYTGTFSVSLDYASRTYANTSGQYAWHGIYLYTGATLFRLVQQVNTAIEAFTVFAGEGTQNHTGTNPWSSGPYDMKITRESDNKFRAYYNGVLRYTSSGTYTGAVTEVRVYIGGDMPITDKITLVANALNFSETP
jgi:hypothetical protein